MAAVAAILAPCSTASRGVSWQAVAAALCRIYYDHDGGWFDSIFPNRLVYRLLVETHAGRQAENG
jgi:hypothetical protein